MVTTSGNENLDCDRATEKVPRAECRGTNVGKAAGGRRRGRTRRRGWSGGGRRGGRAAVQGRRGGVGGGTSPLSLDKSADPGEVQPNGHCKEDVRLGQTALGEGGAKRYRGAFASKREVTTNPRGRGAGGRAGDRAQARSQQQGEDIRGRYSGERHGGKRRGQRILGTVSKKERAPGRHRGWVDK